jgi:DNA ligase (NAD+)
MDIVGLGIKIVEQLVVNQLVRDVADLYSLTRDELLTLEGFADKKVDNLLDSISQTKNQNLNRLIIALGIRGVGEVLADDLAQNYSDLDKLASASIDDLMKIEGVGPNIAQSIVDWFSRLANKKLLAKLRQVGVWPRGATQDKELKPKQILKDKIFVITGTITGFTRDELKSKVEEYGGKVTDSVSKNTSYLIVGEQPGSKLEKARNLGIKIIDIEGFNTLLGDD